LDSAAKKQEFLGKGGLTGIGVANNGKCFAACYFVAVLHKTAAKIAESVLRTAYEAEPMYNSDFSGLSSRRHLCNI
jgi:hypothetical protein